MTNETDPGHADLIAAVATRRDREAFRALFGYFAPRVKTWMLKAGASPTLAEELAQETMLAVWQKAALFDPGRAAPATWIFTIARNQRIDRMRRERYPGALESELTEMPDSDPLPDRVLAAAQHESRIRAALHTLPAEQAEVIRKAFFEDKAHSDIEKELGIPLGTVKSRLRLAMNRLRTTLGDLA